MEDDPVPGGRLVIAGVGRTAHFITSDATLDFCA